MASAGLGAIRNGRRDLSRGKVPAHLPLHGTRCTAAATHCANENERRKKPSRVAAVATTLSSATIVTLARSISSRPKATSNHKTAFSVLIAGTC